MPTVHAGVRVKTQGRRYAGRQGAYTSEGEEQVAVDHVLHEVPGIKMAALGVRRHQRRPPRKPLHSRRLQRHRRQPAAKCDTSRFQKRLSLSSIWVEGVVRTTNVYYIPGEFGSLYLQEELLVYMGSTLQPGFRPTTLSLMCGSLHPSGVCMERAAVVTRAPCDDIGSAHGLAPVQSTSYSKPKSP